MNACARLDVPYFTCSVNTSTDAKIRGVIKLTGRDLSLVSTECMDAPTIPHVPYFYGVVKTASNNALTYVSKSKLTISACGPAEYADIHPIQHPTIRGIVHTTCCYHCPVRLNDKQTISVAWPVCGTMPISTFHNLHVLSKEPVILISVRIVKCYSIHNVPMSFRVSSSSPVIVFHTLQVRSYDPVMNISMLLKALWEAVYELVDFKRKKSCFPFDSTSQLICKSVF